VVTQERSLDKAWQSFNGTYELEGPPHKRSGVEIDILLKDWKDCPPPGKIIKKRKRGEKNKAAVESLMGVWKRRSMFWDLPYWKILDTPHCLDAMNITQNVCESLLGTLFNMPDRKKDGLKARNDMIALNIRKELHLPPAEEINKGKSPSLTPSCFTLSPNELDKMFKCLLGVRFPLGYAGS
jgi:hypothetical protein